MPNTKSAQKALRQTVRRRARNVRQSKDLKTTIKDYSKSPNKEKLTTVYKKLDKAAKVNLIKKNKANRLKSRLSKKIASAQK